MERTGLFISHAHEDKELAQSVRRLLEAALGLAPSSITCTSDADYGLERGEELMEQIRRRLKSARALFLLASQAAHQKDWVNFECGFAERERDAGHMSFYVLAPTRGHLVTVPLPYQGRVAVMLSNGGDLHAFMKTLRKAFGLAEGDIDRGYVDALLDLERRCAALELDAARAERSAELGDAAIAQQRLASAARWKLPLSFAAGVVLAGAMGWWQVTSTREHLVASYNGQLDELRKQLKEQEKQWSRDVLETNNAAAEELRRLPFAGLIQDGSLRPLTCTTVEALVPNEHGEERTVPENCDPGGTFTFSGQKLNSDPRQSIRLRVQVDKAGKESYTVPLKRSEARVAINVFRARP